MTTQHVPAWLKCAVCGRVARPHKIVTVNYSTPALVGSSRTQQAKVCAYGDCEHRYRSAWEQKPAGPARGLASDA